MSDDELLQSLDTYACQLREANAQLIYAAKARIEALRGEVEDLKSFFVGAEGPKLLQQMRGEVSALTAERDRLKAALEPFAKLSTDRERQDPPEGTMRVRVVTVPEIEAARKALGGDA